MHEPIVVKMLMDADRRGLAILGALLYSIKAGRSSFTSHNSSRQLSAAQFYPTKKNSTILCNAILTDDKMSSNKSAALGKLRWPVLLTRFVLN
jgi:hypothetical protein